ncbi:pentatricopeptide repeat-containing protein At3g51320-like [Typha latifolia]|uniref:pentatricopeptide repeat-containing protein At3g51320-like n=1 Tax=Typha latifolia TaxID=4733 RepID=UPI003C2C5E4C
MTVPNDSPPPSPSLLRLLRYRVRSFPAVLQAHAHLLSSGLLLSSPVSSALLLRSSAAYSPLPHTLLLFRHLPFSSSLPLFSLNCLLHHLSHLAPHLSLLFFSSLLSSSPSFFPNRFSFPPLLRSSATLLSGQQCHAQALCRGLDAALHVRNALLHFYARFGRLGSAQYLFDEMPHRDVVSWNSIVDAYVLSDDLDTAFQMFDRMPRRNVVSWNVMISGYVKKGSPEQALEMVREMVGQGRLKGSATTMVSAVTACARLGRMNSGREVHGFFLRNFAEDNLVFWTALVDMYGKCRRVDVATNVFGGIRYKNLVCWNAMIVGQCVYGDPKEGLWLFQEMVGRCDSYDDGGQEANTQIEPQSRIIPDEVTFVGVLCACARAGLLAAGRRYFDQMTSLYKLKPTFAHYWCMANLYGGLGLLQEAEEVLRSMPADTESLAVGGLLGLCRFRGELELGEQMAKRLIELEPNNGSYYALLCSVYVAAGKWDDAQKVKFMMKEKCERFRPGHRLVHLNEIVHNFKVGDRSKPGSQQINRILEDLALRLSLANGKETQKGSDLQ